MADKNTLPGQWPLLPFSFTFRSLALPPAESEKCFSERGDPQICGGTVPLSSVNSVLNLLPTE